MFSFIVQGCGVKGMFKDKCLAVVGIRFKVRVRQLTSQHVFRP